MLADADLSTVADLMRGHRATLLLALIGGRPLSASELAARSGISRSLASAHLSRLVEGGLIAAERRGRQRNYRLAGHHVAEVIEAMLTLAPHRSAHSLRDANRGAAIRHARTCYDHLAGTLGVALTDALEDQGILEARDNQYRLTDAGQRRLEEFGIDIGSLRSGHRAFARPCLDWTERRPHLAGALGAGIAERLLELDWITRVPDSRAIRLTEGGQQHLRENFAINLDVSR